MNNVRRSLAVIGTTVMMLFVGVFLGCSNPSPNEKLGAVSQELVTFDPVSGTGFVGKGDVQLAFGWNNAVLQSNANSLTFTYQSSQEYSAVCEWTTGEGKKGQKTHDVTHTVSTYVNDTVQYDARTHKQVDGFVLTGYGTTVVETGEVPVVGGPCPGNEGTGGVWVSVDLVTVNPGGLYVTNSAGVAVLLQ